jgi:hypothetical protein
MDRRGPRSQLGLAVAPQFGVAWLPIREAVHDQQKTALVSSRPLIVGERKPTSIS